MRIKQHKYISSQQSPYFLPYERRYKKSLYSYTFLDDFSGMFSSEFTPIGMRDGFYFITPEDAILKKLLNFNSYSDFSDEFDQLLSSITHYLLINGRTYLEIVSLMDQNNVIRGIEFVGIPAKCHRVRCNKYRLTAQGAESKNIQFDIDLDRLVIFDLKDIGFHRNYFRKMINHFFMLDFINAPKLMFNPKMKGTFDFEQYQRSIEYQFLKDTGPIHWLGRNYNNQHLSESYHLYRVMQYKILRYKFLQYILHQINEGLSNFKTEWGFVGEISTPVSLSHYEDAFNRYSKGEINTSTLGDIVLKNLTPTEMKS